MDVLTSMSIFCRVVEAGSFTAIARQSNTAQSTISKHIAALEKRLEIKLLNRSTRQLRLTEAGDEYYHHCIRILDDIAESESSIGSGQPFPSGNMRITAPVTFGRLFVAPILWKFLQTYPEVNAELQMHDEYTDIIKAGIDVAIRVGSLKDSSLVARKIGNLPPLVALASPDYLASQGEPTCPADLTRHQCLLHSLQTPANEWEFVGPNGKEVVQVASRFISNNRDTINAAALAGMGIAIGYLWPNRMYIAQGRLKAILTEYQLMSADVYAIYPERQYVPQKVRSLIDYLNAYFNSTTQMQALFGNT